MNKIIDKKTYHFKGTIFNNENDVRRQRIDLFFGKFDDTITFTIDKEKRIVRMSDVKSINYYKNKKEYLEIKYLYSHIKIKNYKISNMKKIDKNDEIEILDDNYKDILKQKRKLDDEEDDDISNDEQRMVCQFSRRECECIIEFFNDVKETIEKKNQTLFEFSMNEDLYS